MPPAAIVLTTFSVTQPLPLMEYFTWKLVAGVSSRFLMRTLTIVEAFNCVDVNIRPDFGERRASISKSLSEIVPLQVPVFGWREIATALLPVFPFILGRTVSQ